ncbi:MBL fold metallo-hydrolase [Peribacillus acanthi]|uniref:MBL fold metallo-hydrolase n=1 Tax=Peribacillus acanthi TaxID=2171554 RepID=UPI000D3E3095|nr:MBL fold metallo-hydrolase [Peribacillus acanthi]
MKLAKGLAMLEISAPMMGKIETIYPTILFDENGITLIDTGYPGQESLFSTAIENEGLSFSQIHTILMTHQDLDHIGSLPAIIEQSQPNKIQVKAHPLEIPYIQGEKRLIKITQEAIDTIDQWFPTGVPEDFKAAFKALLQNPPKAKVDLPLVDGQNLPIIGGLICIHTPGHTPGHMSFYHQDSKTLIAGDALLIEDGKLIASPAQYSSHLDEVFRSIKKLAEFDIEKIICYHGGLYESSDIQERLLEIAEKSSQLIN